MKISNRQLSKLTRIEPSNLIIHELQNIMIQEDITMYTMAEILEKRLTNKEVSSINHGYWNVRGVLDIIEVYDQSGVLLGYND
ncbi:hypothetical protein PXD04_10225 [Methanosphaera sp. ISO3-F5]|uniref:hypothetical protein n=1 Tax=Methanosphaera sp. ISO3-F5 TaxID=1452353 RepID=UPI002B25ABC2|nr:hypothetical protein [Methanosphaera sp. ISO3-F5]WQH64066.1 hypothetical protein PXD04_10225 [Methanosphaera sp. ISO3-F5]